MKQVGPAGRQISIIDKDETVSRVADWKALGDSIVAADDGLVEEAGRYTDEKDRGNRSDWERADSRTQAAAKSYTDQADAANRTAWKAGDAQLAATDAANRSALEAADVQVAAAAKNYTDVRAQIISDAIDTSNLDLDTDGAPFIHFGSMTAAVLQDSDGTPYYKARS